MAPRTATWMMWSTAIAASVAIGVGMAVARSERERRETWPDGTQDGGQDGTQDGGQDGIQDGDQDGDRHDDLPSGSQQPDRTFGLLPGERPADGLKRAMLGQLDTAIELLRGEADVAPEQAVHETRKAIKRLRATTRLLEGELGARRARRERRLLAEVAGSLAGARDAEVMVKTLDGLLARHPRKLGKRRSLAELRDRLERDRARAAARTQADETARMRAVAELEALRGRVFAWRLRDRSAGRLAEVGLERIYRAGRSARGRARARKPGPRAWHTWRKHVKDLRYALEAIDVPEGRGPDGGTGGRGTGGRGADGGAGGHGTGGRGPDGHGADRRGTGGRVTRLARRADRAGEALGEEHDLMLLAGLARADGPLRRHPRARGRLLRAIAKRRAELRTEALAEGERLFERKPKRFVRRVKAASPR